MVKVERRTAEHRKANPSSSIAAGSARLLLARAIVSGATFVIVLLLARTLAPSGRGAVAFVMMAGIVLAGVSGFGLDTATAVLAARRSRERAGLLANLCLFSLAAATVVGGVCALVLAFTPSVRPASVGDLEVFALFFGTLGLRLSTAAVAFLLGCGRFRDQAIATTAPALLLATLLLVVWPIWEISVRSACVVWAVAQLLGAGVGIAAAVRAGEFGLPSRALFGQAFRFGLRVWVGSVAVFLNARVDQVIMGLISTQTALGFYAVAVNASEVALYLPTAVTAAIIPSIARGGSAERIETTLRMFRALLVLTMGFVAVGFACSPLIPVVFGPDYQPSVQPFLLLLPGTVAFVAFMVFTGSLIASSAPGRSSLGPLAALVSGVALDFVLIPPFGATGAAIAATAAWVAGGAVATASYLLLTRIDARLLLPRRDDLHLIRGLARRFRSRRTFRVG